MAATNLYNDVLLGTEECYESETDCAYADVDTLVGSLESARGGEVAAELPCCLGRYRWQKRKRPTEGVEILMEM